MKKILFIVFIGIILLAGYVLLQNNSGEKATNSTNDSASRQADPAQKTFLSSDKRVRITYPQEWHLTDTTPEEGSGQFGPYVESWIIQNFPMDKEGQGGIPGNSIKIDFEIMSGGQNLPLESLIDCQMKTESCERVGINNELFIKGVTTLNTGMKIIQVATFYDSNIFRATAYIQTGNSQATNVSTVEKIFNSISFTDTQNNSI